MTPQKQEDRETFANVPGPPYNDGAIIQPMRHHNPTPLARLACQIDANAADVVALAEVGYLTDTQAARVLDRCHDALLIVLHEEGSRSR
jgi:hypothetical protein